MKNPTLIPILASAAFAMLPTTGSAAATLPVHMAHADTSTATSILGTADSLQKIYQSLKSATNSLPHHASWRVRYFIRYNMMPCGEFPTRDEGYVFQASQWLLGTLSEGGADAVRIALYPKPLVKTCRHG